MRVFSTIYRTRLERALSVLGITGDGLLMGPDTRKEEAETLLRVLPENTPVFIPENLKGLTEGLHLIAVPYGSRLNRHEGDTYTDNNEASVTLRCGDPDTVEAVYAVARAFARPLELLSSISPDPVEEITVHSEEEAIDAARRLRSPSKSCLVYDAPSFSDVKGLSSAFSGWDFLVLPGEGDGLRKLVRALDRVIFSPVPRRLSAVFHSSDRAFCAKMEKECDRVVRITLPGEKF